MLKPNSIKIFFIYLFVSIIYTFPLIFVANDMLIGHGGLDAFVYMWNTSNFWKSILALQSPFYSFNIFYPVGVNLLFNDSSPLISFLGFGFLNFPVFYMNLIVVAGITLSAFICYLLILKITSGNKITAFLGGLIYGLSPTLGSFIYVQHNYYLIASAFLPLSLLLLISFIDRPEKFLKRFILIQILLFFTNYYYFILNGFLSVLLIILFLSSSADVRKKLFRNKILPYYLRSAGFLLISVVLVAGLLAFNLSGWSFLPREPSSYPAICNANLAGTLTPPGNFITKGITTSMMEYLGFAENGDTPFYYLGIIFLFLGSLAVFKFWREKYVVPFAIVFVVILFLSFGLVIRFGQTALLENSFTPFFYFAHLPGLGLIDCPIRFVGAAHLFLALLVSVFMHQTYKKHSLIFKVLIIVCLISIGTDYKIGQFPFVEVGIPNTYRYIAGKGGNRTVLELPSGLTESKGGYGYDYAIEGLHARQMFWQSIHRKPRIGGYISRIPESTYDFFRSQPILSDLFTLTSNQGKWNSKSYSKEERVNVFKKFNLGYIVIAPVGRQREYAAAMEEYLEGISFEKKEDDDHYILYELN